MDSNGTTELISNVKETDLKIQNWIDSDYFKDILVLDGKSNWNYISHEVRMANEKGENYASVLYRVKVIAESEGEKVFLIIIFILISRNTSKKPRQKCLSRYHCFISYKSYLILSYK